MATYRVLSSGRIQAIIRKQGFPAQSKTFRLKREAQKWAAKIEHEIDTDSHSMDEDMSIWDAFTMYENEVAQYKKGYIKAGNIFLSALESFLACINSL